MVRMTDWKRKELSLEQKTGQIYTPLKNTSTIRKNNLKQRPGEKKNMAYITPTMDHYSRNGWMGDTDPRSDIYC